MCIHQCKQLYITWHHQNSYPIKFVLIKHLFMYKKHESFLNLLHIKMLHTFHKCQFRQMSVLINKLLTPALDLSQIFLFILPQLILKHLQGYPQQCALTTKLESMQISQLMIKFLSQIKDLQLTCHLQDETPTL